MTSVLTLDAVRRSFVSRAETIDAVAGVSVSIDRGDVVAIVGPSGSGKSTLLHLILGWELPDGGVVEVAADVRGRRGWSGLAVVPQELGLIPELTARQNVALAVELADAATDAIEPLLVRLDIAHLADRLPNELSLGEQQRVAVARAVSASPVLLVADEPTAHQDERNGDRVMGVLSDVAERGGAVVVATHDDRALASTDRVVRMADGRLVVESDQRSP